MSDEIAKLAGSFPKPRALTDEEKAEMDDIWRQHYLFNYGMTPEDFAALEPEVRVAMMQKAGVEFAAFIGGKNVEGKRRDPMTDPPVSEH